MKSRLLTLAIACGCVVVAGALGWAQTRRQPPRDIVPRGTNVDVRILIEGVPAPVYPDGPYRWIEGRAGDRFAFDLTNRNPFPVGVVLSADGQSLTADGRAVPSHPAYVIEPGGNLTVSLWRENLSGGRELVFTSVDQSLAAKKGDTRNIGVLGALVWQLEDTYQPPRPVPMDKDQSGRTERKSQPGAAGNDSAYPANEGIGVGAGGRVYDQAYLTDRYRRVRVLGSTSIYYDDRAGLIRAGVNLNPYGPPPDRRRSNPFPGEYQGVRIPD